MTSRHYKIRIGLNGLSRSYGFGIGLNGLSRSYGFGIGLNGLSRSLLYGEKVAKEEDSGKRLCRFAENVYLCCIISKALQ